MANHQQAVIRTGGKQYRVIPGQILRVEKLEGEPGQSVAFTEVLLVGSGDKLNIGKPVVSGAQVTAKILRQARAPKVIVYKFKRRKNYRKRAGHRQSFTEVQVEAIAG